MSEQADLRKHQLECLRLETDCRALARALDSPALKAHFTQMAEKWSTLAAWGIEQGYDGQDLN